MRGMKITIQDKFGDEFVLLDSDSVNSFDCDFCDDERPCFYLEEPNSYKKRTVCPICIIKALENAKLLDAP